MLTLSSLPPFVLTHPTTEDKHESRKQSQAASALISNGLVKACSAIRDPRISTVGGFPRLSIQFYLLLSCHNCPLPSGLFLSLSNSMTPIIYDSQNLGSKMKTKLDYSLSLRFIRKVIYNRES